MEKLNELVEQAKFVADWHGSDWSSALCQNKEGKQAHEIICESRGEPVISTGSNSNEASWLCDYLELCSPENILAIAEAFRAQKQRAEAAEAHLQAERETSDIIMESLHQKEAKLAELAKQDQSAVAVLGQKLRGYEKPTFICHLLIDENNGEVEEGSDLFAEPFTRPAPAADLADLVPDELTREAWRQLFINEDYQDTFRCGFSACRAAILRKIEEAK